MHVYAFWRFHLFPFISVIFNVKLNLFSNYITPKNERRSGTFETLNALRVHKDFISFRSDEEYIQYEYKTLSNRKYE